MITYKIDRQPAQKANSQIRDMNAVVAEIARTLQVLQEVIDQQQTGISSPSIDSFRSELQRRVTEAIQLTHDISEDSQKLVMVSDQAGKHLLAIEEHFGAMLRNKNQTPQV